MADAPSQTAVSLSRSQARETQGHLRSFRDRPETPVEMVDLKALARLVVARDKKQDAVSRSTTEAETPDNTPVSAPGSVGEDQKIGETPAITTGPDRSQSQRLTDVSLSWVLGNETPETPWQEPSLTGSGGVQGSAALRAAPSWGEAEEERAAIAAKCQ